MVSLGDAQGRTETLHLQVESQSERRLGFSLAAQGSNIAAVIAVADAMVMITRPSSMD